MIQSNWSADSSTPSLLWCWVAASCREICEQKGNNKWSSNSWKQSPDIEYKEIYKEELCRRTDESNHLIWKSVNAFQTAAFPLSELPGPADCKSKRNILPSEPKYKQSQRVTGWCSVHFNVQAFLGINLRRKCTAYGIQSGGLKAHKRWCGVILLWNC